MNENPDNPNPPLKPRFCGQCGSPLPKDAQGAACPRCLMGIGLESEGDLEALSTVLGERKTVISNSPSTGVGSGRVLSPGQTFGDYRIGPMLGKGGMGEVYEAEDLENGRRVAIKVLGDKIDSPEARRRFLREGRMAAAINHPNSVYIYGTEEIESLSVIAMELVDGGTLKDKLTDGETLSPAEAVDDILEVIEGLHAAHEKGVLHRDIKPSNCFVDSDGRVKVGDFGLSGSSVAREETQLTMTGTVMGTPAFASPEQLRGDPLDVRSDIYSVGATLYYLLTGQPPFSAQNVVQLVATVLDRKPGSPKQLREDLPEGLARVILKCLAKQSDARYRDYESLRAALEPYSSKAATPATLGLRFIAGALDQLLLSIFVYLPIWLISFKYGEGDVVVPSGGVYLQIFAGATLARFLCMSVPESVWGASLGKAICRIRVVNRDGSFLSLPKAIGRTLIFEVSVAAPLALYYVLGNPSVGPAGEGGFSLPDLMLKNSGIVMIGLMFCRARVRNGFSGLHDLATGVRVVGRNALQRRNLVAAADEELPASEAAEMIGPFHALKPLSGVAPGEVFPGFDMALRRRVWIQMAEPGKAMPGRERRAVNRAGRVRWIGGSRGEGGNWDAYESLSGRPLTALLKSANSWNSVRFWLVDLAVELAAAEKDGTLPAGLSFDRVWITSDGRAKLLDFAGPGVKDDDAHESQRIQGSGAFLKALAKAALGGGVGNSAVPLPLHAVEVVGSMETRSAREIADDLNGIADRLSEVTPLRRGVMMAVCALPWALTGAIIVGAVTAFTVLGERNPDVDRLERCLARVQQLERKDGKKRWEEAQLRQLKIYVPNRFKKQITDEGLWNGYYSLMKIEGDARELAEELVAKEPERSVEELERAFAGVKRFTVRAEAQILEQRGRMLETVGEVMVVAGGYQFLLFVVVPGMLGALMFRGGLLLRGSGLVLVGNDGRPAARWRVLVRNGIMWAPLVAAPYALMAEGIPADAKVIGGLVGALGYGLGALVVLRNPSRGLQDRIAGTRLVPQ